MRLLLGSGGFVTKALQKPWLAEIRDFLGPVRRILFIPHALADKDGYLKTMRRRWQSLDLKIDGLHQAKNPRLAVREAQTIMVGGGNTWRLLRSLREMDLIPAIHERVKAGMLYMGASAGTNVSCPTIQTTNDMPITPPGSFEALNLIPFQVNPHYFEGPSAYRIGGRWVEYGGETRDDRLMEFHEENKRPVVGLFEGTWLRVEGRKIELGGGPARLFQRGKKIKHLRSGADLSRLLK